MKILLLSVPVVSGDDLSVLHLAPPRPAKVAPSPAFAPLQRLPRRKTPFRGARVLPPSSRHPLTMQREVIDGSHLWDFDCEPTAATTKRRRGGPRRSGGVGSAGQRDYNRMVDVVSALEVAEEGIAEEGDDHDDATAEEEEEGESDFEDYVGDPTTTAELGRMLDELDTQTYLQTDEDMDEATQIYFRKLLESEGRRLDEEAADEEDEMSDTPVNMAREQYKLWSHLNFMLGDNREVGWKSSIEDTIRQEVEGAGFGLHNIAWGGKGVMVEVQDGEFLEVTDQSLETCHRRTYTALQLLDDKSSFGFLDKMDLTFASVGVSDVIDTDKAFNALRGFVVDVKLFEEHKGKLIHTGRLQEKTDDHVVLNLKGRPFKIPIELVDEVRLSQKDEDPAMQPGPKRTKKKSRK
ncbi:unnamed protein product [Vitrella brassicaformis CCMP3155]|uniref:Ribosome maturation factor RimP N-terminal domain-containing protein n=1 Tax=Vitrella brassicaformis (strain CCMP3155) TaxID=1169540 RepID=A0A0G4F818_VITBC|nr:unnamed protein product [Vitrella brassicaformis CCMP3155]|eukprot:CEM08839.1 unnamed protein product [Vitrella brassicaformis CCMP3155]